MTATEGWRYLRPSGWSLTGIVALASPAVAAMIGAAVRAASPRADARVFAILVPILPLVVTIIWCVAFGRAVRIHVAGSRLIESLGAASDWRVWPILDLASLDAALGADPDHRRDGYFRELPAPIGAAIVVGDSLTFWVGGVTHPLELGEIALSSIESTEVREVAVGVKRMRGVELRVRREGPRPHTVVIVPVAWKRSWFRALDNDAFGEFLAVVGGR